MSRMLKLYNRIIDTATQETIQRIFRPSERVGNSKLGGLSREELLSEICFNTGTVVEYEYE